MKKVKKYEDFLSESREIRTAWKTTREFLDDFSEISEEVIKNFKNIQNEISKIDSDVKLSFAGGNGVFIRKGKLIVKRNLDHSFHILDKETAERLDTALVDEKTAVERIEKFIQDLSKIVKVVSSKRKSDDGSSGAKIKFAVYELEIEIDTPIVAFFEKFFDDHRGRIHGSKYNL